MNARDVLGPMQADAVRALVAEAVAELREELAAAAEPWPAYMDVPTAAAYSGMPEGRVRKLIERRALPVVQEAPGHRVLIARDDLDALLRGWRQ